jgi:hypothetical protein
MLGVAWCGFFLCPDDEEAEQVRRFWGDNVCTGIMLLGVIWLLLRPEDNTAAWRVAATDALR